jgi:hypothetical protein
VRFSLLFTVASGHSSRTLLSYKIFSVPPDWDCGISFSLMPYGFVFRRHIAHHWKRLLCLFRVQVIVGPQADQLIASTAYSLVVCVRYLFEYQLVIRIVGFSWHFDVDTKTRIWDRSQAEARDVCQLSRVWMDSGIHPSSHSLGKVNSFMAVTCTHSTMYFRC